LLRTAARLHMLDLADEAVRIRTTLAALPVAADADGSSAMAVRGLLSVPAGALAELAAEFDARSGRRDDHLATASRELDGLVLDPGTTWRWAAEALLGQLRTACRIVSRLNDVEPAPGRAAGVRP
jgi:hypothetical protein